MTVQTLSPSRPPAPCLWGSRYLGGWGSPSSPVTPGLPSPGPEQVRGDGVISSLKAMALWVLPDFWPG